MKENLLLLKGLQTYDSCIENVYFDVLDVIVNKYKNTYKFQVGDHEEFQITKTFLLKDILQIRQKRFLLSLKSEILFHGLCY